MGGPYKEEHCIWGLCWGSLVEITKRCVTAGCIGILLMEHGG